MRLLLFVFAATLVCAQSKQSAGDPQPGPAPKPGQAVKSAPLSAATSQKARSPESLRFNVNWPSGLSLGEGQLSSSFSEGTWTYAFNVEAAIPGFAVSESARSRSTAPGCSLELTKAGTRGRRKVEETTTFDETKLTAVRTTKDGGKGELTISPCAKDALAFLYYLRGELAAGRLPQSQKVYYGAPYQVSVHYVGTQRVGAGGEAQDADHIAATIKGPATSVNVDFFFARDAARTPLLIQAPLAMGKFSLELTR